MQSTSTQTASAFVPRGLTTTIPGRLLLGLAATLVVAVAAHISFTLPFTAVPLTLQPLAVLGVGLAFGPVGGFLTMLAYLVEGAAGLPVFSPAGPGGVAQLVGFTGGYLVAYPFVAALAGGVPRLLRGRFRPFVAAALGCGAAVVLLYVSGAGWLLLLTHVSLRGAWLQGVLPFLPGEVVKILAASGVYSALAGRSAVKPDRA